MTDKAAQNATQVFQQFASNLARTLVKTGPGRGPQATRPSGTARGTKG